MVIILNDFILASFITWIFILCRLISLIWNHPKQVEIQLEAFPNEDVKHLVSHIAMCWRLEVVGPVGVFIGHSLG